MFSQILCGIYSAIVSWDRMIICDITGNVRWHSLIDIYSDVITMSCGIFYLLWNPIWHVFHFFSGILFGTLSCFPSASDRCWLPRHIARAQPAPLCWQTCYSVENLRACDIGCCVKEVGKQAGDGAQARKLVPEYPGTSLESRGPHLAGGANSIQPRNMQAKPWNQWFVALDFVAELQTSVLET